jgi:L-asparaginase
MTAVPCYSDVVVRSLPDHKARVCLIYTGGTIGSVPTDPHNPESMNLRPASLDDLLAAVPRLGQEQEIELGLVSFVDPADSSHIFKEHWLAIASIIEEHYSSFDGFVVLHGTDTMAFTTSALSFLLNNLAKPVVVTGSQLPITNRRGDGVMNLMSAVQIAGYKATGLPLVPEVSLCFMDRLLRGNRATKVSSESWHGFDSPNFPWLATIGERIKVRTDLIRKPGNGRNAPFFVDRELASEIKIIYVNPGLTPLQLKRDLSTEGLEGVVLLTYGAGTMPSSTTYLQLIHDAVDGTSEHGRPIPILNISQCLQGTVEMRQYEASGGLLEAGVASGDNMTLEAAVAKMYWALRRFKTDTVRDQLQLSHRGEQDRTLLNLHFPVDQNETEGAVTVEPPTQTLRGRFDSHRLTSASLRIKALAVRAIKEDEPFAFRIFLNRPGAGLGTPLSLPACIGEFGPERIAADGTFVHSITGKAADVLDNGPTSVTLVGVNATLSLQSLHLALYLDAS